MEGRALSARPFASPLNRLGARRVVTGSPRSENGGPWRRRRPMRMLWKLAKIVLALALAIPLSIIVLVTALGTLGALFAIAVLVLKVAVVGLIGWGVFRVITALLRRSTPA